MNKKITSFIIVVAVVISSLSFFTFSVNAFTYISENAVYVSTKGNDGNSGTKEAPLKTIEKARDVVRGIIERNELPNGGLNVYFRSGTYYFDKTVEFTELDSGTSEKPIIYSAYPGANVVFSGGITLKNSKFTDVNDSDALNTLPDLAKGKVKQYDLGEYAEKINLVVDNAVQNHDGLKGIMHLIVNDKYATLARWPKEDKDNVKIRQLTGNSSFIFDYEQPLKWKKLKNANIAGWLNNGFFFHYAKIKAIDNDKKEITLDGYDILTLDGYSGSMYYVNLLEELDMENEYYYDSDKKLLYYYPQESTFHKDIIKLPLMTDVVISMASCSNIIIKGIRFEAINRKAVAHGFDLGKLGGAIEMLKGSHNNLVDSCIFNTVSGRVMFIDGTNNGVVSSKFYNLGGGGVTFGISEVKKMEKSNNYIVNCDFSNLGFFSKTYNPGVSINGIGNIVAHNTFKDIFQQAMLLYTATDNIIEYNEISNCMQQGHDMGAVYTQGREDNSSLVNGYNVFRYNYFHDNAQNDYGAYISTHTYDLYLDHPSVAQSVYGNIFENINTEGAIYQNGGIHINISNNIFINVKNAIYARYNYWLPFNKGRTKENLENAINKLPSNMQYNILAEPWLSTYPLFKKAWLDGDIDKITNKYENNILYNTGSMFDNDGEPANKNNISVYNSPFVDESVKNYAIRENSEIYKKIPDYKNIPFERIGKYDSILKKRLSEVVALNVGTPFSLVNGTKMQIDKDNINVMPMIADGRTLVPVRFIAESFGAKVNWDEQEKTVTMDILGKSIKMQVNNNTITVDGEKKTFDASPKIIEGRTLLPLRALVESIGKNVFWDDRGLIVISGDKDIYDSTYDAHIITATIQKIKY